MSSLTVLPSIHPPYTDACVAGMHPEFRAQTLVVDNTVTNRGVAASWNIGARIVLAERHDWLVSLSAGTRFGHHGGLDFLQVLDANPRAWVVESDVPVGWHLIAWSREHVLEPLGIFDENCWPAYGEDFDMSWRILVADETPLWLTPQVDAWLAMQNHGCRLGGVQIDHGRTQRYLARKWGTLEQEGRYRTPFGDATLPLSYWPVPPERYAVPHPGWGYADA